MRLAGEVVPGQQQGLGATGGSEMTGWCWGIWQEKSELGDIICVSNLRDKVQKGVIKVNSWIPWVVTVKGKAHSSVNTQTLWGTCWTPSHKEVVMRFCKAHLFG